MFGGRASAILDILLLVSAFYIWPTSFFVYFSLDFFFFFYCSIFYNFISWLFRTFEFSWLIHSFLNLWAYVFLFFGHVFNICVKHILGLFFVLLFDARFGCIYNGLFQSFKYICIWSLDVASGLNFFLDLFFIPILFISGLTSLFLIKICWLDFQLFRWYNLNLMMP